MHTPTSHDLAETRDAVHRPRAATDHRPDPPGECSVRSRAADTMLFPSSFTVRRWNDPLVERVGFDVRDPYVEAVVLPVVGPSVSWALRCLAAWTLAEPAGVTVCLVELAEAIGLSRATASAHSAVQRTLRRMVRFGLADWTGTALRVRAVVAPVSGRDLIRLSPRIRRLHERSVVRHTNSTR